MGLCSRERMRSECCGCSNFGLGYTNKEDFVRPQGRCIQSNIPYAVYKCCIAVYLLIWIILSGAWDTSWFTTPDNKVKWFIYLTNWSFLALNVNFIIQAALAIEYCVKPVKPDEDKGAIPWHYKMEWVIYNITLNAGFITSVLFWALIYPSISTLTAVDFNTHGTNSIILLVDLFINAIPIRIQHFFHSLIYAVIFILFTIIYDFSGGTNSLDKDYIYSVLDWSSDPASAAMYAVLVAVVAVPLLWCVAYGLYWLRLVVYNGCSCKTEGEPDRAAIAPAKEESLAMTENKVHDNKSYDSIP